MLVGLILEVYIAFKVILAFSAILSPTDLAVVILLGITYIANSEQ